jgi:hypothetical protein
VQDGHDPSSRSYYYQKALFEIHTPGLRLAGTIYGLVVPIVRSLFEDGVFVDGFVEAHFV